MGLKKYEIITVGSDKRVRALRSWQVGDRYVNIGDVGGIVYDEKTLSQDGACWLFRGNFNFPGARIGGDSIVDVGEAAPDAAGSSNVDILGTSTVVGAPVKFTVGLGPVDGLVLSAADFEQGDIAYSKGLNWETWKRSSDNFIRLKAPVFMGGVAATLKLDVPGYAVQAFVMDRDGIGITVTAVVSTGKGVTLTVPAGQYFIVKLRKDPVAAIVPADATAAKIKTTAIFDTKLVVVDSRLELNPVSGTGAIAIRSGGLYSLTPGAKYPDTVIQGSKVVINSHATTARMIRMLTELVNVNATIDATTADAQTVGIYHGVNNLVFTGLVTSNWNEAARSSIQAYDCDNMVVSPTIFPGLATAMTANMPFIFQGCNVPNGRFYHHVQIANTYKNIDFALAKDDLGKLTVNGFLLASSEVNSMYRVYSVSAGIFGGLVESHESVKSATIYSISTAHDTTIYKDAYLNGVFDLTGTNVFGNKVRSYPLAQVLNVQPRAVRGGFDTATTPPIVVSEQLTNTVMNVPLRINGKNGLKVENVPAGVRYLYVILDANLKFVQNSTWKTGTSTIEAALLRYPYAMIQFNRESGGELTPEDLAGVTVTVYNGCKLVNTGKTAINMKGNIRVEDNATLINASVTGSGYFGGNSVASGVTIEGCAYMKDNAVIVVPAGSTNIRSLKMTENAYAAPASFTLNGHLWLSGNSRFIPQTAASGNGDLFMNDNTVISGAVSVSGSLTMKDNATISAGTLTTYGDITVCGSYSQTVNKTWTGNRVIASQDAPTYDDNVKTQYDF